VQKYALDASAVA